MNQEDEMTVSMIKQILLTTNVNTRTLSIDNSEENKNADDGVQESRIKSTNFKSTEG